MQQAVHRAQPPTTQPQSAQPQSAQPQSAQPQATVGSVSGNSLISVGGGPPAPSPPPSELRIALTMCGGIALTLYDAGVAHELYRFFKSGQDCKNDKADKGSAGMATLPDYDNALLGELLSSCSHGYAEAFRKIPIRPVVDILTGASAGGINSIFLASCIATGRDFANFHDVWIDEADIKRLQFNTRNKTRGLLDTEPLRQKMVEQLRLNLNEYRAIRASGKKVEDPGLFVRLCRAHLGMTDKEYEERLVEAQTAILQQEAALHRVWHQRAFGETASLKPFRLQGNCPAQTGRNTF